MDKSRANKTSPQSQLYVPEEFVDKYGVPVFRFCRSLTYSKEDAEDLFQETFLQVFEKPHKLNATSNPQSLLFSTALFIWKSWKRKYARRRQIASVEPLDETVESDIDIENNYLIQEEIRMVRGLVETLPEKYKIPTILYYTLEMNITNIAMTLHIPEGTVKSRLHKARNLIEKGLGSNQ